MNMKLRNSQQNYTHLENISSKLRIYALRQYIYGLKSFKVEYCEDTSEEHLEFNSPVYACKFGRSPSTLSLLALAYENGRICVQEMNSSYEGKSVVNKKVHDNAIFDISWVCSKPEFITAVADSSLHSWGFKEGNLFHIQQFKGHSKCVKSVDTNSLDANMIVSGGRDCSIIIWDKRCQPDNKANEITDAHSSKGFHSPHTSHRPFLSQTQNCVISVLFSEQTRVISAGASDGMIKIWDLRKTYGRGKRRSMSLFTLKHTGCSSYKGFTSLSLSPFAEKVYASCLDGNIYAYHLVNPTFEPVAKYYGHKPSSYYTKCCLSPCGNFLLSGSSDDRAYVWLTKSPGLPIASLTGHLDEVTSVAWSSTDQERVVTCSDDLTFHIFKFDAREKKQLDIKQKLRGFAVPFENGGLPQNSKDLQNRQCIISPKLSMSEDSFSASNCIKASSVEILPCNFPNQVTPHRNELRSGNGQVTPKTSERKTLLSWFSSSKTPNESLTHQLNNYSNQEDLVNDDFKASSLPRKWVLNEIKMSKINSPANCVAAKMLKYEDVCPKQQRHDTEESENFKLIDDGEKSIVSVSSVFSNSLTSQILSDTKTPVKNCNNSENCNCIYNSHDSVGPLLSSPTANLPNYMLDGRSPHCRRENPLPKKQMLDWLTSLKQKDEFSSNLPSSDNRIVVNCKKNVSPVNYCNKKRKRK